MDGCILYTAQVRIVLCVVDPPGIEPDAPNSSRTSYPAPLEKTKTSLTMKDKLGRTLFKAKLAEDPIAEDPTSIHGNADVPPFHGYSKAGKAEGQLVYAHVSSGLTRWQDVPG